MSPELIAFLVFSTTTTAAHCFDASVTSRLVTKLVLFFVLVCKEHDCFHVPRCVPNLVGRGTKISCHAH